MSWGGKIRCRFVFWGKNDEPTPNFRTCWGKNDELTPNFPEFPRPTFTVTLVTRTALASNPPLQLTITAARLLDALGRPLDGNDSGQPGANFVARLSKTGVTVTSFA